MIGDKYLIIEILGIPGSGKSTYFEIIRNKLGNKKNKVKTKKFFEKIKDFIGILILITYETISTPKNLYLLLSIFDYFIDDEHKKSFKLLVKRFWKIYRIYLLSKIRFISINKIVIQESIIHLSINSKNKNPRKFIDTIKKLYKTKNIIFLYLDINLDITLKRMTNRGDNIKKFYDLRKKRYKFATIFQKNLLKEIYYTNNSDLNLSNLYLNSESTPLKNIEKISTWLNRIKELK